MNYNKLQKTIQNKSSVAEFCSVAPISEAGYYKMLKAKSLKVEMLERFSAHIKIPMSYWWEDDKKYSSGGGEAKHNNNLNESEMNYGETITRKDYEKHVASLEDHIETLKKQIAELKG